MDRVIGERFTSQLLTGARAKTAVAVAERLLAVQAQDQRAARLAIRARASGLTASDVYRALTEERSLVISWLNRGTLHLVRSEDYPWLHALMAPFQLAGNRRRLAQEGVPPVSAKRGVAVVERSLVNEGPLTRAQLAERIRSAGVRTEGQALVHVLALASLMGLIVRGPMIGNQHAFALAGDWLRKSPPFDRDAALAELARRYLAGHGPASDRDLALWAGLPLRDARAGLRAIASELSERGDGLVSLAGRKHTVTLPPPRLLGAFDPLLLGWTSRDWILGNNQPLITAGGLFRPFALVRGRAVATWTIRAGMVVLEPFTPLLREERAALKVDADDVLRYLNLPRE